MLNLLESLRRLGVEDPQAALSRCEIACIGPVTARTAEQHGLTPTIVPDEYTIEGLVQALVGKRE